MISALLMLAPVTVLAHPVERGALLTAADFTLEERPDGTVAAEIGPDQAEGQEAVRWLPAGTMLRRTDIASPRLVKRGEPVTLRIRSAGLLISTSGRSLADGRRGDTVRVMATATRRTLEGQVEGPSSILVVAQ